MAEGKRECATVLYVYLSQQGMKANWKREKGVREMKIEGRKAEKKINKVIKHELRTEMTS